MTPSSRRASSPNLVRAARRDEPPAVERRLGSVQVSLLGPLMKPRLPVASITMPQR